MRLRSMLILTSVLALGACERTPENPDSGGPRPDTGPCTPVEENTAELCSDGIDNDCDGHADCNDFGCCAVATCGETTACGMCTPTPENTADACSDGVDNDCDGHIDCRDFDCKAACGVENSNPRCIDGLDNDNNGFVDCDDRACQDRIVCAGEASNANCSDGEDNDGDGDVDCADSDCQDEAIVVCDGANPVDPLPDPSTWAALVADRCSNGVSDDGDARLDCGEFSCLWNHPGCDQPAPERGNAQCSDGVDNDLDGLTDCEEDACREEGTVVCRDFETDGTPIVPPMDQWETLSNAECSNGMNDDADLEDGDRTFVDCEDNSCTQNPDVTFDCEGENTNARCSDGIDNDPAGAYGHGFIDCDDNKCRENPRVTVCTMVERSYSACSDGIDNDGNTHFDCADFSCKPSADSGRDPSPACM